MGFTLCRHTINCGLDSKFQTLDVPSRLDRHGGGRLACAQLYRAFFARRYHSLFPRIEASLLASALVFAWLHLIFRNHYAVILTLVGGWFFAQTYARTHSLRLVCFEHALYGNLIFTIGLGNYFLENGLPLSPDNDTAGRKRF
jgi:hypothetical protein